METTETWIIAVVCQFAAMVMAAMILRKKFSWGWAWIVIATALMLIRRGYSAYFASQNGGSDLIAAWLGVGVSLSFCLGVWKLRPIFLRMIEAERVLQRDKDDLEKLVGEKTKETQYVLEELQKAMDNLFDSHRLFELVLDAMPFPIMLSDHNNGGRIEKANKAAKELGAAEGGYCHEVFGSDGNRCSICRAKETLNTGESVAVLGHFDGQRSWNVTWIPIAPLAQSGMRVAQRTGLVLHFRRDVTNRMALEKQLLQSQKMEAVGTLTSGIAHEFNNILAIIIGYAELAQGGYLSPGQSDALRRILKASEKAAEIVRQLLIISRREEGAVSSLNQGVEEALVMLRASLPKNIILTSALDRTVGQVRVASNRIFQMVLNMGINAGHAMPEGGNLKISTYGGTVSQEMANLHPKVRPGEHWVLEVSDSGRGMTPEILARIYEPFFTTKGPGRGTGLGLSICFKLVENAGGFIDCQSAPGQGTTFKIYLPKSEGEESEESSDDSGVRLEGSGEVVLVVDDEEPLRAMLGKLLKDLNFRPEQASSGEEALKKMAEGLSPDLAILDLGMPGMGGAKALDEMLKLNPGLSVIIATGYLKKSLEDELLERGAKKVVRKPYLQRDMLLAIKEVLGK